MNYKVRQATTHDAAVIKSIAEENNEVGSSARGLGFYEMPKFDLREHNKRIKDNPLALVSEVDNEIIGFILGYTDDMLYKIGADPYIAKYLSDKPKPFVLLTEIAMRKDHQGNGIGKLLFKSTLGVVEKLGIKIVWCNIVHKPVKNKRSPYLVKKFGFNLDSELKVPEIGITFGMYKKENI